MNVKELVDKDTQEVKAYYCSVCGSHESARGQNAKERMENCCRCSECGEKKDKNENNYYTYCKKCEPKVQARRDLEDQKKRLEKLAKAEDVTETFIEGPVYCEALEMYFGDVDEFCERAHDEWDEDSEEDIADNWPEYIHPCHIKKIRSWDAERLANNMVESILDDQHEDCELEADDDLISAIQNFLNRQTDASQESWYPDFTKKINVKRWIELSKEREAKK